MREQKKENREQTMKRAAQLTAFAKLAEMGPRVAKEQTMRLPVGFLAKTCANSANEINKFC